MFLKSIWCRYGQTSTTAKNWVKDLNTRLVAVDISAIENGLKFFIFDFKVSANDIHGTQIRGFNVYLLILYIKNVI